MNKYEMKPSMSQNEEQEQETPKLSSFADITIIFDRSGSMKNLRNAVVEGFNCFVQKMRGTPGNSKFSLVQFDEPDSAKGANEEFPKTTFADKGETEVPLLALDDFQPRGGTALVDACCLTIKKIEARLSGQDVKPIIAIFTDGHENSSREFASSQLREMVSRFQSKGAEFLFFGANIDAFGEASKYNISPVTPTYAFGSHYGASVASGGLAANAQTISQFAATDAGMRQAIFSGMVAVANFVSGGTSCVKPQDPNVVV